MTFTLVRKLLRDIRVAWIVVTVLLFLFQIPHAILELRIILSIVPAQ